MVRKQSAGVGEAANMFEDEEEEFDSLYTGTAVKQSTTDDDDAEADVEVDADADTYPNDGEPEAEEGQANLGRGSDDEGHPSGQPEIIAGYPVHRAASAFPLMEGREFEEFVQSIADNGQREPVDLQGDLLIEGRNRARAVELLRQRGHDITLLTKQWEPQPGQTVAEYVADKNLHRRHFADSQRAQIAAELVPLIEAERAAIQKESRIKPGEVRNPGGRNQHSKDRKANAKPLSPADKAARNKEKAERTTVRKIATTANVTDHKARQAAKIKAEAPPETVEDVKAGRKKPKDALAELDATKRKKPKQTRAAKPIDHPFMPSDDFERAVLLGWIRLVKRKVGVAGKARGRRVMQAIFKAEEDAERGATAAKKGGGK